MRCCASPTTFTAADPRADERRALAQTDARAVMSAVLFREILKPLTQGLGPVGEIALGAVADELFVRNRR